MQCIQGRVRERLTPLEQRALDAFLSFVGGLEGVLAVYLYGSRQRGESSEESDLDVLVLCDRGSTGRIRRAVERWRADRELAELEVLHPVVVSVGQETPLQTDVIQKGVLLWQKTGGKGEAP